jgi:hypothetical protein
MKHLILERLDDLLLTRLALNTARPPTAAAVAKSLYAFASRELSPPEWDRAFSEALERVRDAHLVEPSELRLTATGKARVKAALRLEKLPASKSWKQFRTKYVPRLFLEMRDLGPELTPNCGALVLAERLSVRVPPDCKPSRVVDIWLARKLGLERLTLDELRNTLLAQELGLPRRPNAGATTRLAVANLAGATSADAGPLLEGLTARWLYESPRTKARRHTERVALPAELDDELGRFALRVRETTTDPELRGFGDNKVFIGSVWQALASDPEIGDLGEREFKRRLVEAHRRGSLVLARADLVAAMDPEDVSASETVHQNSTYHFIQRGQPA